MWYGLHITNLESASDREIDMLTLKPEHLKYAYEITNIPEFLYIIDFQATNTQQIGKPIAIQPSALGITIEVLSKDLAKNIANTSPRELILMNLLEFEEREKKRVAAEVKNSGTQTFLWAAVKCIATLYAANNFTCPYMPRNWLEKGLAQKRSIPREKQTKYFSDILAILKEPLNSDLFFTLQYVIGKISYEALADIFALIETFITEANRPYHTGAQIKTGLDILEKQMPELDLSFLDK